VTNNTGTEMPGTYQVTGDALSLAGGWFVDVPESTRVSAGTGTRGVTRSLSPIDRCYFILRFEPGVLCSGDFKAKINVRFGSRKAAGQASITLVRI
jgi:hypothetical protein